MWFDGFWRDKFNHSLLFLASALFGIVVLVASPDSDGLRMFVRWLALIALVLSVGWLVGRYAKWMTTNLTITNDRIVYRYGVIAKHGGIAPKPRFPNSTPSAVMVQPFAECHIAHWPMKKLNRSSSISRIVPTRNCAASNRIPSASRP